MALLDQQEEQQELLRQARRAVAQLQVKLKVKSQQLVETKNELERLRTQLSELQSEAQPCGILSDAIKSCTWRKWMLFLVIGLLAICIPLSKIQGLRYAAIFGTNTHPATNSIPITQTSSEYVSPAYSGFDYLTEHTGCQDAYMKGARESGVYAISRSGSRPFRAWCDFDSSGGWMVIQRRVDGTVDFFRSWAENEQGFGSLWEEYWLGLDKMHLMTSSPVALSVYLVTFDGESAWANYSAFSIGDSASQYTLTVSGFSGSAGDSLSYHNGLKFSTWDRDNDRDGRNCAQLCIGSWWYKDCYKSNLNGRYEKKSTTFYTSNCWSAFKGHDGLKQSVMRIHI